MNTNSLNLSSGDTHLTLRPGYGGRITRLAFGAWEVLRPVPENESNVWAGYKGGNFPLLPFSNRIQNATFTFDGRRIPLTPHPSEPNALHGHGCFSAWTVDKHEAAAASLSYTHAAGNMGWPWPYRAEQHFDLAENECRITLKVSNLSGERMPLGFGFHPFFTFEGEVLLRFSAVKEWGGPSEEFPTERLPVRHDFGAADGNPLWKAPKTICFDGFGGRAEIHWLKSGRRLRLLAGEHLDHFIVHVPVGSQYFCLEPVCHPPDGFNLFSKHVAGVNLKILEGGQSVSTTLTFIRV
ncbi:MAG: aldose 1-epimerase [Deltaproteobacteria bacterium]|nr:aldose 1-epimerase [Deltaproteobacteria bacterium]